ncbi:MAG: aminotransferase class V-fold PLP-dependent enzyme [Synechococcaceae cyanobacterium SM2_3_1]|nr:aminotransferase class V-fold PLP-dependent enzyme [Synechococcaceae cyanobacterium SM2_3_1]
MQASTDLGFGVKARQHWCLDPECIFLNHGSFGATPRVVLEAQHQWQQRLEAQPVRFMAKELAHRLRDAAATLATFVGAAPEDLVFVENATTGVNTVLRSLDWQPQDEIVATNHGYRAVQHSLHYLCQRTGAQLVEAPIPFPLAHPQEVIAAVAAALNPRTRLVVLDHIASSSALILPLQEIIEASHNQGIPVLVDGAHAPGMIPLDLQDLGADWYTGNAHKWLSAPKGCAFLWTHPQHQHQIHPLTISHGYGGGYVTEFDWTGTRDPSAWLAIPTVLEFWQQWGWEAVRTYNQTLVQQAGELLAAVLGCDLPAPASMIGAMLTLPLPLSCWQDEAQTTLLTSATELHDWLWEQHQIEVPVFPFLDRLWIRISAQIYNHLPEYVKLADCLGQRCL